MNTYFNINYDVFPNYIVKIFQYRLYAENLSQFTVYSEAERLKSFLRYVICFHKKIDLKEYSNISDYTYLKLSWLKNFSLPDMLNYISFITDTLQYSPQYKANTILTVKMLYRYLYKLDYLNKYMFSDLAVPRYSLKNVVYMDVDDCQKLFSVIDNCRDRAIIYLLLNTGARRCEVANALLKNLDLVNKTLLVVGKGEKERFLYLNNMVCEALKLYLNTRNDNVEYLFITKNFNKISYNDVYRIVKKYIQKAGLDATKYSTHKLRHTFATLLYQNGTDLKLLKELLGHSNIDTTTRYTHLQNCILSDTVDKFVLNKK